MTTRKEFGCACMSVILKRPHEQDEERGACEFARFFHTTPEDLVAAGLYSQIALAFHEQPFRHELKVDETGIVVASNSFASIFSSTVWSLFHLSHVE